MKNKLNRIIYLLFGSIILSFAILRIINKTPGQELPLFLKQDEIVENLKTPVEVKIHSKYKPDSFLLENLKSDYRNIWAHINHFYMTNDIMAGKEYYTESWMRQLSSNYDPHFRVNDLKRSVVSHHLYIQNWSTDGLVCTAIDSNAEFIYHYPNGQMYAVKTSIATILLYQGDHWRIDALRVIDQTPIASFRK